MYRMMAWEGGLWEASPAQLKRRFLAIALPRLFSLLRCLSNQKINRGIVDGKWTNQGMI